MNRTDKLEFMLGAMAAAPYDPKEHFRRVEEAVEMGAGYFQTSFPRNKLFITSVRRFAQEIIPSFG